LETYAVLTAFPAPYRARSDLVQTWLEDRFADLLPPPPPDQYRGLIAILARNDRIGGSIYDGVIGLTAKLAGATLVTADARAVAIYELVGIKHRLLHD
jgi:predicted nucleic acid-binding protein